MSCGCTQPGSYAQCAGFQLFLTDVEGPHAEWASFYAQKVGAPYGKDNATTCSPYGLVVSVILSHRFPYYKDSPGDCGHDTKVNISGAGASKALSIGGTAAGTFSGITGIATGTTSIAAGGIAGAGAIAGIAAFGAGLLLLPLAFIAHHSAEVALEQKVLCAVSSGYNDFADQVEGLLKSGSITLDQANNMADQMQQQIVNALASGLKSCNARCYYTYAIKAVTMFCKERWYPALAAQAQKANTPAVVSDVQSLLTGNSGKTIAVGGGLILVLLVAKLFAR